MEATAVLDRPIPKAQARGLRRWRRRHPLTLNMIQVLVMLLSLTVCCVIYVRARATALHERYLLEEAQQEQERIQMENRTLRLTWATYTSPKVLDEAARKRFHLHYPRPNEVVRLP